MTWWEAYRKQFPAVEQCVYLDTAYDCGGSLIATAAARQYFTDWAFAALHNERGGPGRATLFATVDETRRMLTQLVGIAPEAWEQIAFTRNTNEGINAVLQGFNFRPGDNIVTGAPEHTSVLMPCLNAGKTRGVEVRVVPAGAHGGVSAEALIAAADAHTRMIVVSHVQSACGYRVDLQELGAWRCGRDAFLVVDAIQSLGLQPFCADEWHVDAVAAAAYKALAAVNSTAFAYYSPALMERVWPVYAAANPYLHIKNGDGGNLSLVCEDARKARKMENSSLDNLGIYILHDSVREILRIGPERIWAHILPLYKRMFDGLAALVGEPVTPRESGRHCGILALRPEKTAAQAMFEHFRGRGICLSLSAGEYIRFSLGPYNSPKDITRLLNAARDYRGR